LNSFNFSDFSSNLDSIESNKDLLALHNGAWATGDANRMDHLAVGQDKIVRIFAELMRNMSRMKTYIRPSMCKPYGKQSESLQKSEYLGWEPVSLSAMLTASCLLVLFPDSPHGHHSDRADAAQLPPSSSHTRVVLEK